MNDVAANSGRPRALLAAGALGCPLFIIVFLIAGAIRPDYSALRYPVSSLSIGPQGWLQVANFLITGILIIAFAVGIRHTLSRRRDQGAGAVWGPLLIGLTGVGLVGAGIFTTDPVFGYPPDQPLVLAQFTTHGRLHDLFSVLVFLGLPLACFVFARRFALLYRRGWAIYSALSGVGILAAFVLAAIGFNQTPGFVALAGLYQRLSIGIGWLWLTLLALHLLGAAPPPATPPASG